jgi:hypothetical protein
VITHWESNPSDNLPTCTQSQILTGTCALIASATTSTSTTTTTLPFDQLPKFKQDAARELKQQLQQSIYPCFVATTGLVIFLVPSPGTLAVSGTVGPTMLTAGTYACAPHVQTMVHLWKVFKDPPDPAFRRIAHVRPAAKPSLDLPACTGFKGKDRSYCRRLEHAATRWAAAVAEVESVAAALETTANRVGGARAASDTSAVKKQTRAADRLDGRFDAADRARARAGAKLAAVLRPVGTTGMLTDAQSMQGVGIVLGQLAVQGFGNDEAQALFGSALTPGALDLLQVLGEP